MLRKFLSYAESWRRGLHKVQFNSAAARVVTLTTSTTRLAAMQKGAHDLVMRPLLLPAGIYLFGIQATLADPFGIDFEDTAGHRVRLLPTR